MSRCTRWATVRPPFLHSAGPLPPFLDGSSLVRDRRGAFLPGQAVHFRRTVPGLRRRPLTPVCQRAHRWDSCKRSGKSAGKFPVGLCGRPGMRESLTDWRNSGELEGTAIQPFCFSARERSASNPVATTCEGDVYRKRWISPFFLAGYNNRSLVRERKKARGTIHTRTA